MLFRSLFGQAEQETQIGIGKRDMQKRTCRPRLKDSAVRIGLPGQICQNMAARTGLPDHRGQDRNARVRQPGQDRKERTPR